ncbi:MAG: hypothetical protein ABI564_01185 [Ideonella sp.]
MASPNSSLASIEPVANLTQRSIPELVAEVYEAAPAVDRGHLLEELLRPLGILSLVAVADGIFAKIRFRSGWQDLHVRLEDIQNVRAAHVIALVDHAQQVSIESVDGLAQMLAASPAMSGSAASAMLVALLLKRTRSPATAVPAVTSDAVAARPN